jgi:hypothetical protein
VFRTPFPVMCAGEGTTTGTAPRPCAGLGEGLPAGHGRSCRDRLPSATQSTGHHMVHRHDQVQSTGADETEA